MNNRHLVLCLLYSAGILSAFFVPGALGVAQAAGCGIGFGARIVLYFEEREDTNVHLGR
jgi:hypothetical protein